MTETPEETAASEGGAEYFAMISEQSTQTATAMVQVAGMYIDQAFADMPDDIRARITPIVLLLAAGQSLGAAATAFAAQPDVPAHIYNEMIGLAYTAAVNGVGRGIMVPELFEMVTTRLMAKEAAEAERASETPQD